MEIIDIILSIISVIGVLSSILFNYLAFHRNTKGDSKQSGKNEGVLISDVGYINLALIELKRL